MPRTQRPKCSIQRPASSVQCPEFSVQGPASRIQRPESSVQLLRPESRNSGMLRKTPGKTSFFCLDKNYRPRQYNKTNKVLSPLIIENIPKGKNETLYLSDIWQSLSIRSSSKRILGCRSNSIFLAEEFFTQVLPNMLTKVSNKVFFRTRMKRKERITTKYSVHQLNVKYM